jgi:dihydroorotase
MGVTGLETAFAVLHTDLVESGVIDLPLLISKLGGGAELFGLERPTIAPGAETNIALCDLSAEWTVGEEGYESRSANSCFAGRELRGRVLMTVAAGQVAYRLRSFSMGVAA